MKRYYFLLGAIVVCSAGYIGWRLATPPIPDAQLSGDLMDRVELPRTLSDSDTDALLRMLRSDDPIAVRNALGAASVMMKVTDVPRRVGTCEVTGAAIFMLGECKVLVSGMVEREKLGGWISRLVTQTATQPGTKSTLRGTS